VPAAKFAAKQQKWRSTSQHCHYPSFTMMTVSTMRLLAVSLLLSTTCTALDVALDGISCDESFPVFVKALAMTCAGGCTFGGTALLQGKLQYNGVQELHLRNNSTAYIAGEFDVSVDVLQIPNDMQLDLCDDNEVLWITATDDSNVCPEDGVYEFEATLELPSYGNSWWATGWHNVGEIRLYADQDYSDMIGSCEVLYVTQVTSQSFLHVPSAFTVCFLVGAVALVGVTFALYFIMCIYKPRRKYKGEADYHDDEQKEEKYYYLKESMSKEMESMRSMDNLLSKDNPVSGKDRRLQATESGGRHVMKEKVPRAAPAPAKTYSPPAVQRTLPGNPSALKSTSLAKNQKSAVTAESRGNWLGQGVGLEGFHGKHVENDDNMSGTAASQEGSDNLESSEPVGLRLVSSGEDASRKNRKVDEASIKAKRWRFRVLGNQTNKGRGFVDKVISYSDSSDNDDSNGSKAFHKNSVVELVKSVSSESNDSSLSVASATDQSSESSTQVSLSSSSSSSGFVSFSSINKAEMGASKSADPHWESVVPTVRQSKDGGSMSSSSCDALSYIETNQTPTGNVQGLIQYADWIDACTASMPAPSSAILLDYAMEQGDAVEDHVDAVDDQGEEDAIDKFRQISKSTRKKAALVTQSTQTAAQRPDSPDSFLDEKPSTIVWEKSTLNTGYHRFDL